MEINDDKTITLDEEESMLFHSFLEGSMNGINKHIANGYMLSKDEREVQEKLSNMLGQLEDSNLF